MNQARNLAPLLIMLTGATALLVLLWIAFAGSRTYGTAGLAGEYGYGTRSLVGASNEQIAAFAVEYLQSTGIAKDGSTPEVMLSQQVTRAGVAALGLGCMVQPIAIEEPPLALVILRGRFGSTGPGYSKSFAEGRYLAVVFDMWSASPARMIRSLNGGEFGRALKDPSLVLEGPGLPSVCPTDVPRNSGLHYGDVLPTANADVPVFEATPTSPVELPAAVTTPEVPIETPR